MKIKPDYGIDAPRLVRIFLLVGAVTAVSALAVGYGLSGSPMGGSIAIAVLAVIALYCLGMGGFMIRYSRVTKCREREQLLDLIVWRGDETVLDVGCGRGLMLIGAARRLSSGRAVGIDIWQARDQSSNTPDGAIENARLEGVADRVVVQTADMRQLPFGDASIDIVLSHWAVHNLADRADRDMALGEMARVLKPEGTLLLTDIENRAAYRERLMELDLSEQRLVVAPLRDAVLRVVSFGSFRPATIIAGRRLTSDR